MSEAEEQRPCQRRGVGDCLVGRAGSLASAEAAQRGSERALRTGLARHGGLALMQALPPLQLVPPPTPMVGAVLVRALMIQKVLREVGLST